MKIKLIFLLLTILFSSCTRVEEFQIESIVDFVVENNPSDFNILLENNNLIFVEMETSNRFINSQLQSIHYHDNHRYFFVFQEGEDLYLCFPGKDDAFHYVPFSTNHVFGKNLTSIAWVSTHDTEENQFNLRILDLMKQEMVLDHSYEFNVYDAIQNRDLTFNHVTIEIDHQVNDQGLGSYYFYPSQAGYTFRDDFFHMESGKFYQSWGTIYEQEPMEWQAESFRLDGSNLYLSNSGTYSIEVEDRNVVAASTNERGFVTLVVQNSADTYSPESFELISFNKLGKENRVKPLSEVFPIGDPIIEIHSIVGTEEEAAFIIETEEFNYDLRFNAFNSQYTLQLRFKDFDRFVH